MDTHAFSRVLQVAYPAVIALAAISLSWTNSVHGNNLIAAFKGQSPDPDFSAHRAIASVNASCSIKDRWELTRAESCPNDSDSWTLFDDEKDKTVASRRTFLKTSTPK
jgi:hypothetical protein